MTFCGNDREWFLCPHCLCVEHGTHAGRKTTGRAPWWETISLVCLCTLNPSLNRSWTLCLLRKEPLFPGSPDQNHLNGVWWLCDGGGAPRQTEGWQWVQGSISPSLSLWFYTVRKYKSTWTEWSWILNLLGFLSQPGAEITWHTDRWSSFSVVWMRMSPYSSWFRPLAPSRWYLFWEALGTSGGMVFLKELWNLGQSLGT